MVSDKTQLAERLKAARLSAGVTQDEAARHLDVPRTAIVNLEAGERSVSTLELTKLARLYRRSVSELLSEMESAEDIFVVLHRLDDDFAEDPSVKQEVSNHIAICREGHDLKMLLEIPEGDGPPEYHLADPESIIEAVEHGSHVAKQERSRLSLGSNPLPDLAKLIASQGIWAAKAELPDVMSGMFLHDATFGVAILINARHPLSRRRFSFAHEYAHALLDRRAPATISSTKNRKDFREVRANAFAAAFLLPGDGVRSFLRHRRKTLPSRVDDLVYDPLANDSHDFVAARTRHTASHGKVTYQDVASLMCYFRTSYQATCYRLKSLNLVTKDELAELLGKEEFAKQAFALLDLFDGLDGDPGKEQTGSRFDEDVLRLQVVNLAVEAYRREEISSGRLRDISRVLHIPAADLLKLAEAA